MKTFSTPKCFSIYPIFFVFKVHSNNFDDQNMQKKSALILNLTSSSNHNFENCQTDDRKVLMLGLISLSIQNTVYLVFNFSLFLLGLK